MNISHIPKLNQEKIQSYHRDRLAIVYIRQSSLQQVERNNESTKLQYNLVDKAYALGWPANRVIVIDDDLGRSGANAEGRPGFQRLVAEVGLDHVGIILGIEISRLARSCRDWYQLLEVCALFKTLIADADGVYDPALYNDRLLLGLKGTMSEAELHILKQRMIEGKNAKARRGELRMHLPMGYVCRPSGEIIKDPDEQAQFVIQLVFDLFDRFAAINAVLNYLVRNNIKMPYRHYSGLQKGELDWRRPNRMSLRDLFHNPIYAGAYVYGRRPTDPRRKKPGRPSTGRLIAKPSEWMVLIKNKIPAYISWEKYELNQKQLISNSSQGIGVPRRGSSLLAGLIRCGRCGRRMAAMYTNNGNQLRYACTSAKVNYGGLSCQSLIGAPLDECIVTQVLEALKPSALEISLQVAEDIEQERKNLSSHWERQLERARYEVERAYRQYNMAEPENRLVARTLEKKWEEALLEEEKLKQEHANFITKQPAVLSSAERESIRQLASDIPGLWFSPTTTSQERQEIIRILIERIIVIVENNTEKVSVEIHWSGGYKTSTCFVRPVAKFSQLSYYDNLIARLGNLRKENKQNKEIASILNQEGWRPTHPQTIFTESMVGSLMTRAGMRSKTKLRSSQASKQKNEWTLQELSQKVNLSQSTLYKWIRTSKLKARKNTEVSHGGIWLITANEEEIKRLQNVKNQPKEWIYSSSRIKKMI
jgi:DNA invertase Pin-like site-specific DNA recombinase